jgi:hypothetical protein
MRLLQVRVILLSLFAVLAVGAVASASASATVCEEADNAKDTYSVCVGGKEFAGELRNKNTAVASTLKGTVLGFATELKGSTAVAELAAEDPEPSEKDGASTGKITFTNIVVVKPAKCKVKEPVVATFTDQLSKTPGPPTDLFTGAGGLEETFTELTFEGAECALKGNVFKVKGTQRVSFDAAIENPQEFHEVIATAAGSNLKLGPNAATFEATFKEIGIFAGGAFTKELWSIRES